MNVATSEKAIRFMEKHPVFIGRVNGMDYYEHPELGDESPLIYITPDGKVKKSCYYDLPDIAE